MPENTQEANIENPENLIFASCEIKLEPNQKVEESLILPALDKSKCCLSSQATINVLKKYIIRKLSETIKILTIEKPECVFFCYAKIKKVDNFI